jgi:hypothetical protein
MPRRPFASYKMTASIETSASGQGNPCGYVRVVNLAKHQHYKERRPPWIKLHRTVLESYRFGKLDDASKWLALGVALLASESDNCIPMDPEWIAKRLQMHSTPNFDALLSVGFIERCDGASSVLADEQQDAMPEAYTAEAYTAEAETDMCAGAHEFELPDPGVPSDWYLPDEVICADTPPTPPTPSRPSRPSPQTDRKAMRSGKEPKGFAEFWAARPRRSGGDPRGAALKAYRARLKEDVTAEEMLDGIRRYAEFCHATVDNPKYIKMTSTFLSKDGRFWEEDWLVPGRQEVDLSRDILEDI